MAHCPPSPWQAAVLPPPSGNCSSRAIGGLWCRHVNPPWRILRTLRNVNRVCILIPSHHPTTSAPLWQKAATTNALRSATVPSVMERPIRASFSRCVDPAFLRGDPALVSASANESLGPERQRIWQAPPKGFCLTHAHAARWHSRTPRLDSSVEFELLLLARTDRVECIRLLSELVAVLPDGFSSAGHWCKHSFPNPHPPSHLSLFIMGSFM